MSNGERVEDGKSQWLDSFRLHHPMDRAALAGVNGAALAEDMLTRRKEERERLTGENEAKVKNAFTGTATIFKGQDGSLYAMVHTEWVGEDGEADPEITSWHIKVPITEAQLQTMREARGA